MVSLTEGSERTTGSRAAQERPHATVDPSTGEQLRSYPFATSLEVDQLLDAAHRAFLFWRELSVVERAGVLRRAGELMLDRQEELAELQTLEMGKRLKKCVLELGGSDPFIVLDLESGGGLEGNRRRGCRGSPEATPARAASQRSA